MGTRGFFLGIKRSGREANHSPPSSAEINNAWKCTSTPQYVFMVWCLVKHRDNFIFTFYVSLVLICVRFEISTAMEIQVVVLWVITLCSDVLSAYRHFGAWCYLHLQGEDRCNTTTICKLIRFSVRPQ
jgi:hypothetical protein